MTYPARTYAKSKTSAAAIRLARLNLEFAANVQRHRDAVASLKAILFGGLATPTPFQLNEAVAVAEWVKVNNEAGRRALASVGRMSPVEFEATELHDKMWEVSQNPEYNDAERKVLRAAGFSARGWRRP